MKIKISEVWNAEGKSVELAKIEIEGQHPTRAYYAVTDWVKSNRPDLSLADTIYAHGYHAVAV